MAKRKSYLDADFDLSDAALTSSWDETCLWSSYFGAVLLDAVDFKRNAEILDIGSGTGFPLLEIAQRFGKSSHITGIDPWEAAVKRLHFKAKAMEISNYKLLVQKAESLPFADSYFDLIVSNVGINNVDDPPKVMQECRRVCKRGGQFVMTTNLPETMIEFYDIFKEVLTQNNLGDAIPQLERHISAKRMTMQENINLIEEGGFKIKDIKEGGFALRFLDGTSFLNHHFIKLAFLPSWKKIVPEDKLKYIFEIIENELNKLALKNGELSLTVPYACFNCTKN
jgi:ubiquinone/menaquinone biosynthesis C-methylase UbiE